MWWILKWKFKHYTTRKLNSDKFHEHAALTASQNPQWAEWPPPSVQDKKPMPGPATQALVWPENAAGEENVDS